MFDLEMMFFSTSKEGKYSRKYNDRNDKGIFGRKPVRETLSSLLFSPSLPSCVCHDIGGKSLLFHKQFALKIEEDREKHT